MGLQSRGGVQGGGGVRGSRVSFGFRSNRFGMEAVFLDTSPTVCTLGHAAVGQDLNDPEAGTSSTSLLVTDRTAARPHACGLGVFGTLGRAQSCQQDLPDRRFY